MPWMKRWGNRQMSRLISLLVRQRFFDVSCGMRCYSKEAFMRLNMVGNYTYTQEVFLNLAFSNLRIVEVPMAVRGQREHGKSRVASNLFRYAVHTLRIIFAAYRDHKPLQFFGGLGLAFGAVGAILGGAMLVHYLVTGTFSPYKWVAFLSAGFVFLSAQVLLLSLLADMLKRHRRYMEEILYSLRCRR